MHRRESGPGAPRRRPRRPAPADRRWRPSIARVRLPARIAWRSVERYPGAFDALARRGFLACSDRLHGRAARARLTLGPARSSNPRYGPRQALQMANRATAAWPPPAARAARRLLSKLHPEVVPGSLTQRPARAVGRQEEPRPQLAPAADWAPRARSAKWLLPLAVILSIPLQSTMRQARRAARVSSRRAAHRDRGLRATRRAAAGLPTTHAPGAPASTGGSAPRTTRSAPSQTVPGPGW